MQIFQKKAAEPAAASGGSAVTSQFLKDEHSSSFILGAIDDGVVIFDRQNIIHLFNRGAANLLGWAANEAVGQDFNKVMPLFDAKGTALPPEQNPFTQALVTGQTVRNNDCVMNSKNGRQMAVSITVSPIIEQADRLPQTAVAVFRDITVQKQQEQQRSDFISTASHEMRTPIAAIEGYLSLVLNEKVTKIDDNARKYLMKAQAATKHLGQLFADLLTSSKADDGRLSSNPVVIEIGELLGQVVEAEQFHAEQSNLELKYVLSNNDVAGGHVVRPIYYAFVDPTRMNEVFQNIIDNAIKYTPQGSVTVRLTGDLETIQVQVQDTGPGIPSEDIPHLFQKFYRVDNSATRTVGGTGLGLYICKIIVELYKGRIWVESQLGKGSTFFINLPRLTTDKALELQKNQASVVSPTG
ncbi:MAG TPA: ATP-binding protein [Candidatus Saccharimonadales bacterium]|nr:ATP-binding protein [Candidatus Saccharimonadales bacterium]